MATAPDPVTGPTSGPPPRPKTAAGLATQYLDWVLKAGSLAGVYPAIAAAFQLWPFTEPPDVRIDIASSRVNSPGSDSASAGYVCLVNKSGGDVGLLGWELRDAGGDVNLLPDVTISPGQHIRVHPGGGTDTEGDLYGEGEAATWNNGGDVVTVLDDDGNVIDSQAYGSRSSESMASHC